MIQLTVAAALPVLKAVQSVICCDLINTAVDHLVAGQHNKILIWIWDVIELIAGEEPSAETIAARAPQLTEALDKVQARYEDLKANDPEALAAAKEFITAANEATNPTA